MDKYIGKRLEGRYDILELIGTGGMANVYRAHDIMEDRTVAIKILRDEYMNNSDFLRRFKNESKAIALLNHPNIVRVLDVSFSGVHSIVMEHIDGVTLKEYISHTGPLPWRDAVYFTIQVLHALQHAHDKGIVHRDIKPQNIMLLRSGEIKVTDFGIARFARSESRTVTDRAIGSVHYISPEQAMGEDTDARADIYSTGIMLFEMLTGQLPFEAESAVSVAMKQVQSPIIHPRSLNPSIPIGLEEITLRAAQKNIKLRYQSAAEMISALEKIAQNPNITFGYPSAVMQAPQPQKIQKPMPQGVGSKNNLVARGLKSLQEHLPKMDVAKGSVGSMNDQQYRPQKKKSQYLRMMFVTTLAVVFGSMAFIGIMVYLNNPFIKVGEEVIPDFTGKTIQEIGQMNTSFEILVDSHRYDDVYRVGTVAEQRPLPNSSAKVGSRIKLVVSDGRRSIEVLEYKNTPSGRAFYELKNLGLAAEEKRMNHDTISAGRVVRTDPPAGALLSGGDKIVVFISEGPEKKAINVPNIVGLTKEKAIELLESAGFTIGNSTEELSEYPEGVISSQYPLAGSLSDPTIPINIGISAGYAERLYLSVPLPTQINRNIFIRARTGEGENPPVAAEETLNPSQSSGYWSAGFVGEPGETLRVIIYIDGRLYQVYRLDFENKTVDLIMDRTSESEFQS